MASEVRAEAAEVADVFITGEVLQSNTIDYPQGFVIKPSENQNVYSGFHLSYIYLLEKKTILMHIKELCCLWGRKQKKNFFDNDLNLFYNFFFIFSKIQCSE